VIGPADAMSLIPRAQRMNMTPSAPTDIVGVGWSNIVQPTFDGKCISCHEGTPGAANPTYTITDKTTGQVVLTWTFNLKSDPMTINYGNGMMETFSASYFTMAGPDMEAIEKGGLMINGNFKVYMNPEDAAGSLVIQKVNPTQLFPVPNASVRAFTTAPHSQTPGGYDSGRELTATEFYKLILAADMGVNYYSRDNNPRVNAN
jgi:hypothetical protein